MNVNKALTPVPSEYFAFKSFDTKSVILNPSEYID